MPFFVPYFVVFRNEGLVGPRESSLDMEKFHGKYLWNINDDQILDVGGGFISFVNGAVEVGKSWTNVEELHNSTMDGCVFSVFTFDCRYIDHHISYNSVHVSANLCLLPFLLDINEKLD